MKSSTLIKDAKVVADGKISRASLLIKDAHIADIITDGAPCPSADVTVDASALLLFPGIIDEHVHFRDPGLTHKATMASESSAAVAGGVTTVFDMPNTIPQTTSLDALKDKEAYAAQNMHTNFAFYLGATNDNIDDILRADLSHICGIKLFMGSSTGGMLVDDDNTLRRLFSETQSLIAAHCEDENIIRANSNTIRAAQGDNVDWIQHATIRSREACLASSSRAAQLARETGARLHILHITTADELDLLDSGDNRKITGEACPAHLWFSYNDYRTLGPLIKCNPSIKTFADCTALRQAVASGRISTIGTDHAPHTLDEKNGHSYWQTPSGMPMIQHSLPLMLRLADEGWWDYPTVAARMAENVADLYGLKDRGHIKIGNWADLTLVSPTPQKVQNVLYKCQWSPLKGVTLNHSVVKTYVSGRLAFDNGSVLNSRGSLVSFNNK